MSGDILNSKDHKTLKGLGKVEKKFKDSIFIGYAAPVESEEEAKNFINKIKNFHSDASHNVYAYIVRNGPEFAIKYDDDGEPKGSSGKPVMKILEHKGIENVVVVVTRYFGGTKLGYGGLVKAYSETASDSIENAGIIEVYEMEYFEVELPYNLFNAVKNMIENRGTIVKETYSDCVVFGIEVKKGTADEVIHEILDLTKGQVKINRSANANE